jgi:hypothetical protein
MMTKTNFIALLLLMVFLVSCSEKKNRRNKTVDKVLSMEVFQTNEGWGYNILMNDKVFIHQDMIPAIHAAKPFSSKQDAEALGTLMLSKLKENKMAAVSVDELKELGIKEALE